MDPLTIMTLQLALVFAGFAMIVAWHVGPAMQKWPLEDALALLCLFHSFRYIALAMSTPGQTFPPVGDNALLSLGADVMPAALAIATALMLHARKRGAIQAAWIFNLIGLADIAVAAPLIMASHLDNYSSGQTFREAFGLSWHVFAFYAPALVITHIMMLRWLFRHAAHHTEAQEHRRDQLIAA
jgi:hypothetical protein